MSRQFTFSLHPDEARTFTDIASLLGTPEQVLASGVVQSFLEKKSADPEIQAGLKAMDKLRRDGTLATRVPARHNRNRGPRRRVAQGRSLTNLPNGLEAFFAGEVARVSGGKLELDGQFFSSPSPAAVHAAGGGSYNGWVVWKDRQGRTLADIHQEYERRNG